MCVFRMCHWLTSHARDRFSPSHSQNRTMSSTLMLLRLKKLSIVSILIGLSLVVDFFSFFGPESFHKHFDTSRIIRQDVALSPPLPSTSPRIITRNFTNKINAVALSPPLPSSLPRIITRNFTNKNKDENTVALSPPMLPSSPRIIIGNLTSKITIDKTIHGKRICTSPEYNVPWPLKGSTPFSCGMAANNTLANFFNELTTTLHNKYYSDTNCRQAIRFGAAFGLTHAEMLKPTRRIVSPCAFMFVLEEEMPPPRLSTAEHFVPIPRHVLPYKNMRRNVKLFKLHGHLLFPFAKTLVWQDVKLNYIPPHQATYFRTFLNATDELDAKDKLNSTSSTTACLTAMGLPIHVNSFGNVAKVKGKTYYTPKYQHHCNTVVKAVKDRPTVTDSTTALLQQCKFYRQHDASNKNNTVALSRGLIDSAFLVWNHDSPKCRDFNRKLACSWSSEIRCFSDRDQISFPYVLQQMGLKESEISKASKGADSNLYLVDDENDLMVRILKSDCHWYYGKFPQACFQ